MFCQFFSVGAHAYAECEIWISRIYYGAFFLSHKAQRERRRKSILIWIWGNSHLVIPMNFFSVIGDILIKSLAMIKSRLEFRGNFLGFLCRSLLWVSEFWVNINMKTNTQKYKKTRVSCRRWMWIKKQPNLLRSMWEWASDSENDVNGGTIAEEDRTYEWRNHWIFCNTRRSFSC